MRALAALCVLFPACCMASGCNPLQKGGEVFPRMYLPSMPIQGGGGSNVLGNGERAEGVGERPKSNRTKKKKRKKKKKKSPGRTITRSAVESVVRGTRHKLLEPRAKAKARSQNRCPGSQRRPRTECSQGEDACEGGRFELPSSHG